MDITFDLTPISNWLQTGPFGAAMNVQMSLVRSTDNQLIRASGQDTLENLLVQAFGENHGIYPTLNNWTLTFPECSPVLAVGIVCDGIDRLVVPSLN